MVRFYILLCFKVETCIVMVSGISLVFFLLYLYFKNEVYIKEWCICDISGLEFE